MEKNWPTESSSNGSKTIGSTWSLLTNFPMVSCLRKRRAFGKDPIWRRNNGRGKNSTMERHSANSQPIFLQESLVRISAKTTRMYPKGSMSRWVEHLPDSDSQLHWVICARGSSKANKSNSRPWVFRHFQHSNRRL